MKYITIAIIMLIIKAIVAIMFALLASSKALREIDKLSSSRSSARKDTASASSFSFDDNQDEAIL